ncbi:[glutamate--ammonia-ligase] adenylyltransferase [Spirochaeta thermophila]|uniref:Glutamate-ammonia-ligase adenylyltransferase n=1 Tax=Winmispira thermophila (strain ATCC 49972 / DSM 6192 / RI 19.B1) TaxID=665571 RepID=E0RU50_WINT6|nr:[glutamate--ammonia-ligase] adenylyltransferase [Spirochaeta thermophila]ADN02271.1 glutamate-ammonia-ligase adenylyltransferase [Spirochaeta thermophila DSM 6192]
MPDDTVALLVDELMPSHYAESFPRKEREEHDQLIRTLSEQQPYEVKVHPVSEKIGEVCMISVDVPGIFSLYCGLLGTTGFNIRAGSVFTGIRPLEPPAASPRRRYSLSRQDRIRTRRLIIDRFTGVLEEGKDFSSWKQELEHKLARTYRTLIEAPSLEEGIARAREELALEVARYLHTHRELLPPYMYPVLVVHDETVQEYTRIRVASIDTPFFLYALGTALHLNNVSVENVQIATVGTQVEDIFDFVDSTRRPITDPHLLRRLKLSLMLTKHFTYFIAQAPDPSRALIRFEHLLQEVLSRQESAPELLLSDPRLLDELAVLLGTSDFLWEEFVRLHYDQLLPFLKNRPEKGFSTPPEELGTALRTLLSQGTTLEEKKRLLNEWKNRELYLIDLDHLLMWEQDFRMLSERLTLLAEVVVQAAMELAWEEMTNRYGVPRTVAGMEAEWAVFGLGKLGGAALGYASDLELLCVFSDQGRTDGPEAIDNAEFFERLFRQGTSLIEAKKEGIFQVDLRLRPHGDAGPLACSLESFVRYYGKGGGAHSAERLALVRMRRVAGSTVLGDRVERLRDELVYEARSIDMEEIRSLRAKQIAHKTRPGTYNVKFSPGGLVDIEYAVQILQIRYGAEIPEVRTPRIHVALEVLHRRGILKAEEADHIVEAYYFLRKVINGLRMLRGNALDLELPERGSLEYEHLARRIGYRMKDQISAADQLRYDIEAHTAYVRTFVERHLGDEALPPTPSASIADLVLGAHLAPPRVEGILSRAHLADSGRALRNIHTLTSEHPTHAAYALLVAWDVLRALPDPDMALNNWERFYTTLPSETSEGLSRKSHFTQILSQPGRIDILLKTFSASQYLADTLIGSPHLFEWLTDPKTIHTTLSADTLLPDLQGRAPLSLEEEDFSEALRRFKQRHLLRIGIRDICFHYPLETITRELSLLAEAILTHTLAYALSRTAPSLEGRSPLALLAFGKLGGGELNYSSDIDLLPLVHPGEEAHREPLAEALRLFTRILTVHTSTGFLYRVDYRLRPFGEKGLLIHDSMMLRSYYEEDASPWEYQAALKLRGVAGDERLSEEFLSWLKEHVRSRIRWDEVREWNLRLRHSALQQYGRGLKKGINIKQHEGGLRDIEFGVQALQLKHLPDAPDLWCGNTLTALDLLVRHGILGEEEGRTLSQNYRTLRALEHVLQLMENRQTHTLPSSGILPIVKRLDPSLDEERFKTMLDEIMHYNRDFFRRTLETTA